MSSTEPGRIQPLENAQGHRPEPAPRGRLRQRARLGAEAGVLALIVAFAVLNVRSVTVNWIFGSGHAPLIVVILVSLVAGVFIAHVSERRSGKRR